MGFFSFGWKVNLLNQHFWFKEIWGVHICGQVGGGGGGRSGMDTYDTFSVWSYNRNSVFEPSWSRKTLIGLSVILLEIVDKF